MDRIFISEFAKHPREISTILKIQSTLAKPMAAYAKNKRVVAEFGSGTGAITKYILDYLPQDGKLYCFEINPVFCRELEKITDKRIKIINASAQNLPLYLSDAPDCIISSIPLQRMNKSEKEGVLEVADKVPLFVPMQYFVPTLKKDLESRFDIVEPRLILLHMLPSWFYVCRNNED